MPDLLEPSLFASLDWLRAGITTRSFAPPDEDRLHLAQRAPSLIGTPTAPVVVGEQVHGAAIAAVGSFGSEDDSCPSERAVATPEQGSIVEIPAVDGLATQEPGVVLGVFTADCVPIVLVDPHTRAFAVLHAGREGTRLGIAPAAARLLLSAGSRAQDLLAWIAPAISQPHYQVSEQIAADFQERFGHYPGAVEGRHLALAEINRQELLTLGIPPNQIELHTHCTHERVDLFHSYRRDGAGTGRMFTFACRL